MPKINVFCKDNGWLFDDLKREIASFGAIASKKPLKNADAWICVRESEAHLVPDKRRCLLQVHDVKGKTPSDFGQYSFVHNYQKRLLGYNGLVLPIGSREIPSSPLPKKPTIGFFCKEYGNLKRSDMFADAVMIASYKYDFEVLIIGDNLSHIEKIGKYEIRGANPADYSRITALVTCSVSPIIPLSAYEALAAGRAVISTPREWPFDSDMIFTGKNENEIADLIGLVVSKNKIYNSFRPFSRQYWAKRQYQEALKLCK